MRLSSSRRSLRSLASSDDSGSSISVTAGSRTSARPIATRCIWPPDSLVAGLAQLVVDAQQARHLGDLAPHLVLARMRRIGERSGKARLSNTLRCG